jgi:hypothetical protein
MLRASWLLEAAVKYAGFVFVSVFVWFATALVGCGDSSPSAMPEGPDADPTVYSADCDPILGQGPMLPCAMPWPSSLYLQKSPTTRTGYALSFGPTSLPESRTGRHISPDGYRKLDGYGPSTPILVVIPNLDRSGLATEDHIERSLAPDAAIVILEDSPGKLRRVPYWVEPDLREGDPAGQTLFVRPAEILKEATRYVVAFRNLREVSGAAIQPARAFVRLRDRDTVSVPVLKSRQARFDETFATLGAQGIDKGSLVVAWDFVTASNEALHGDLLQMRDDALARVGAMGPPLTVDSVVEYAPTADGSGKPVDPNIALEIQGSFAVPSYLTAWTPDGFAGSQLNRDKRDRINPSGTRTPRFWVRIPYSAVDGKSTPHGLVLYGHGLLGSGSQVHGDFNSRIANQNNLIFFSADLTGMTEEDQGSVIQILSDLSRFPSIADRLHQGLVEWVLLARAMRSQLEALNRDELFYSGISQGGIFGGSFVALSPDVRRGHLGVPGSNYSLLLQRSADFDSFGVLLGTTYPSSRELALAVSAMQLLWDATDPVTHYRHISAEPYPGTPPHQILLAPARGDYQVAVLSNEVLARSGVGVSVMAHYDGERQVFGVHEQPYPYQGSGVVLWHFGNPWPMLGNQPPMDAAGDPHEKPRRQGSHNAQMVHFFRTGEIKDVCGGMPCWPDRTP